VCESGKNVIENGDHAIPTMRIRMAVHWGLLLSRFSVHHRLLLGPQLSVYEEAEGDTLDVIPRQSLTTPFSSTSGCLEPYRERNGTSLTLQRLYVAVETVHIRSKSWGPPSGQGQESSKQPANLEEER
jgi:hypothetical protein